MGQNKIDPSVFFSILGIFISNFQIVWLWRQFSTPSRDDAALCLSLYSQTQQGLSIFSLGNSARGNKREDRNGADIRSPLAAASEFCNVSKFLRSIVYSSIPNKKVGKELGVEEEEKKVERNSRYVAGGGGGGGGFIVGFLLILPVGAR